MTIARAVAILLFASLPWSGVIAAAATPALEECRARSDPGARLECYDALSAEPDASAGAAPVPALEQRIEKQRDLARRAFAILPYRPNYLLYTYNSDPNEAAFRDSNPDLDLQEQELKFQISLRVPIWYGMFDGRADLWFGYTQVSFWQAFNSAESSPFRETNYEPELGVSIPTDFAVLGLRHKLLAFGLAHQSNGRSEPLSRSWNRVWVAFSMERENFALVLKPWYRLPEDPQDDDNPDIEEYMGRIQLRAGYKFHNQVFSLILHNTLRAQDNRSGDELDWSFPYSKRIKGLLQYYNGYGESLIDYNVRTQRIGFGVLVEDWL
jgi:phospholipase A1